MSEVVEQFLRNLERERSEEDAIAACCELAAQHQTGNESELTRLQARFHRAKARWLREFATLCRQIEDPA